jgi:hypothetical protein
MKNIVLILFIFSVSAYGQEFRKFDAIPDTNLSQTIIGKRITYAYRQYAFEAIGTTVKIRMNKKLILNDEAIEGQKKIVPHIFIPADTSDFPVLMIDHYSDALFGFSLYKLSGLESMKIGFFPLAALAKSVTGENDNVAVTSMANQLLLETDGSFIRISFNAEQILLRPGTDQEEIVPGDQVKFLFNGKKLKEVQEF